MKTLIKQFIKPLYKNFTNKNIQQLNRLFDKIGKYKRYEEIDEIVFLNYKVKLSDYKSFVYQFKEIFCDEIYKFKTINKSPVIIDCGSNIGLSLLFFSKEYPDAKIIGFEADLKLADIIKTNLSRNLISNVQLISKAVWINSEGISFLSDGADGGRIVNSNQNKIESVRLKNILENESTVDFLKIDVEGAENIILDDCANSLGNVNNIFIEYHSFNKTKQDLHALLDILSKSGFRYYLQNEQIRQSPFLNKNDGEIMDMQINIFGYRD